MGDAPPRRRRSAARAEAVEVAEKAAQGCGSPGLATYGRGSLLRRETREHSSLSFVIQGCRRTSLQKIHGHAGRGMIEPSSDLAGLANL
jgi:hypothetical protein